MKFVFVVMLAVALIAGSVVAADTTNVEKKQGAFFGVSFAEKTTPIIGYTRKVSGNLWSINSFEFGKADTVQEKSQTGSLNTEFTYLFDLDFLGIDFIKDFEIGPLIGSNVDVGVNKVSADGQVFSETDWVSATGAAFIFPIPKQVPFLSNFDITGIWKYKADLAKDNSYDNNTKWNIALGRRF